MKWFSTFLFIYMLALAYVPCSDNSECHLSVQEESVQMTQNHAQHQHNAESCTALCSCSCCGVQISTVRLFGTLQPKNSFVSERKYISHLFTLPSDFMANIWQPPKLNPDFLM